MVNRIGRETPRPQIVRMDVMKRKRFFKPIFYLFILISSCLTYGQIMNGSFETESGEFSSAGWVGFGVSPCSDTPPGGGSWSIEITGGCVAGTCMQTICSVKKGDIFEVHFWTKRNSAGRGSVEWCNGTDYQTILDGVPDTIWTYYSIADTLDLQADGDSIYFQLSGGGGIAGPGSAFYDLVEVNHIGNSSAVQEYHKEPHGFLLYDNYPNPFNPFTTIKYFVPKAGHVGLTIYNVKGQEVKVMIDSFQNQGVYELRLDLQHVSSGIYFCKIFAGESSDIKKMIKLE